MTMDETKKTELPFLKKHKIIAFFLRIQDKLLSRYC